jgi:antitoxin MazE
MRTKLVRIGNSRGIRIPKRVLDAYGIREGDELDLEQSGQGIVIRPARDTGAKLSWVDAYDEMAREVAEASEWETWDSASGDGIEDSDD